MKDYSNVTTQTAIFSYYSINQEYYNIPEYEEIIQGILHVLARRFESTYSDVLEEFQQIYKALVPRSTGMLDKDYQNQWTSGGFLSISEGRVLADLINWYRTVISLHFHQDHSDDTQLVFNYSNLNTGASLSIIFLYVS